MAKYIDYKKLEAELFKRTEGYAAEVRKIYREAFTRIINLVKGTKLQPGKPFSFSDYGYSDEVTPIFRDMYSRVYQVIRKGVEKEWMKANEHNDDLVKGVFGDHSIEDHHFARFFARNQEAMDAFFSRKAGDHGLNLSQRVWNYNGQFKEELENALDLAIGEGCPANRLAKDIQKYLNDPDRFYRRFRVKVGEKVVVDENGNPILDKNGNPIKEPIYGRKWKRRIWDDDSQSYKWIDADPKHYHPGRGVYRSSYRNAQRLARTETNIAYRTADYDRWQRMDFVIGIEIKLSNNHPDCDICDDLKGIYPKNFKWVGWHPNCRCYQEPVLASETEVDQMLDKILDGDSPASVDCAGAVEKLPGNYDDWAERNADRMERARENGTLPYFIRDNENKSWRIPKPTDTIQTRAKQRHDARTEDYINDVKRRWSERKAIYHYGENILNYMGGISDVDVAALQEALHGGNYQRILTEAQKLRDIGKRILSLDKLDNPIQVAKDFSMADAMAVNKAVTAKLATFSSDLTSLISSLEYEIGWVTNAKKYHTWEVAANAYKKALAKAKVEQAKVKIQADVAKVENFIKTSGYKGKKIKDLLAKAQDHFAKGDLSDAEDLLHQANTEIGKWQTKNAGKGIKDNTPMEKYCSKNRTFTSEVDDSTFEAFQDRMISDTGSHFAAGSAEARQALKDYTDGTYDWINSSYWRDFKGCKEGRLIDEILDNCFTSKDMVLRRGCSMEEMANILGNDFLDLMRNLDIDTLNSLAGRKGVNEGFISTSFDMDGGFWKKVDLRIFAPKGTQAIYAKPFSGFGDCHGANWDGKTASKYFSRGRENEIVVHRGYEYRFIKAKAGGKKGSHITIYVELLTRNNRVVK